MATEMDEATQALINQLMWEDVNFQQGGGTDIGIGEIEDVSGRGGEDGDDDAAHEETGDAGDWNNQPIHAKVAPQPDSQQQWEPTASVQNTEQTLQSSRVNVNSSHQSHPVNEHHDLRCAAGEENSMHNVGDQAREDEPFPRLSGAGLTERQDTAGADNWEVPNPQHSKIDPTANASRPVSLDPYNIEEDNDPNDYSENDYSDGEFSGSGRYKDKERAADFPKPSWYRGERYSSMPDLIEGTSTGTTTNRYPTRGRKGADEDSEPEEEYSISDLRAEGYKIIPLPGDDNDREGHRGGRRKEIPVIMEVHVGEEETLDSILKEIREKNGERF